MALYGRELTAGQDVARHLRLEGQRRASIQREHLLGIVGGERPPQTATVLPTAVDELLRPLQEYEAVTGGAW